MRKVSYHSTFWIDHAAKLKDYRYPWSIISFCAYLYYRFSLSYRDIEEMLLLRGVT